MASCAASGWFQNLRTASEWLHRTYGSTDACVEPMATLWVQHMEAGQAAIAARPDHCCAIRYEDLLTDPRRTLASILSFLDVDADPAVIDACLDAADFSRLGGGRKRGEEDRSSFIAAARRAIGAIISPTSRSRRSCREPVRGSIASAICEVRDGTQPV